MCWCRPEIRTPFCGRSECHPPGKPHYFKDGPDPEPKPDPERVTLTLDLTKREAEVLAQLAEQLDLSKNQTMRQALRMFQLVRARLDDGETIHFSGDAERAAMFYSPSRSLAQF